MALAALADIPGGWPLLAICAAIVAAILLLIGLATEDLWRPWVDGWLYPGAHTGRAGLDVVASLAPRPAQSFDINLDEEWTEARWQRQFRAHHSTAEVFAAEAQAGGWVSGPGLPAPDWPPDYPGYGWPDDPGGLPPVPGPPATGPDEHGRGPVASESPPVRPSPPKGETHSEGVSGDRASVPAGGRGPFDRLAVSPATLRMTRAAGTEPPGPAPEVAHDEYAEEVMPLDSPIDRRKPDNRTGELVSAGPAPAVVPPPAPEWAGPVPPTPDDDALAAQVRAWCSEMDAATLNYLHDYVAELRAA